MCGSRACGILHHEICKGGGSLVIISDLLVLETEKLQPRGSSFILSSFHKFSWQLEHICTLMARLGKERRARYPRFKREVLLGDRRANGRMEHGRLPGRRQVMGEATSICLYRWNYGVGAQVSRALFGLMGALQWAWHQLDIELKTFFLITSNLYLFSFIYFFFLSFFIFFQVIFISWRLVTLQYCSGFCHTLAWISHGFTCVPHPEPASHLPSRSHPSGSSQCTGLEHLSHAFNLDWWSVSHLVIYMFQCCSLRSSHPRLLP